MRLLSPWALVGLIAIAGPIAAHLLARRPPKTLRFPNLRFLPPTVPTPVTRHRLADHGLLVLRIAVIALAVFALAGPAKSGSSGSQVPGFSGASGPSSPSGASGSSAAANPVFRDLTLLTAPADRADADAAFAAAVQQGAPRQVIGDRDVAVVFPGFQAGESLLKDAPPLSQPWMSDLFTTIAGDQLVQAAADRLNRAPLDLLRVTGDRSRSERLLVFMDAPAHSLFATATIAAVLNSVPLPSVPSGNSAVTSVPSAPIEEDSSASPLARWVWLAVGLLLLAETLLRRRRPASRLPEEHARVA